MAKKSGIEVAAEKQASTAIIVAIIGAFAIIIAAIISGLVLWLKDDTPPGTEKNELQSSVQAKNGGQSVNLQDSSNNTINISQGLPTQTVESPTQLPPIPPENFPSRGSFGLTLLTEGDRKSSFYGSSPETVGKNQQ